MNNTLKRIIYLLSNINCNSIIIRNWVIHNNNKPLKETSTIEYINKQGYNLNEARRKSFIMLKDSPHLWCKGPKPLYLNNCIVPNSRVYAYLGKIGGKIMYTKYTLNDHNKNMLMFNSWHESKNPHDYTFTKLY